MNLARPITFWIAMCAAVIAAVVLLPPRDRTGPPPKISGRSPMSEPRQTLGKILWSQLVASRLISSFDDSQQFERSR